jgi:hypothetical protein
MLVAIIGLAYCVGGVYFITGAPHAIVPGSVALALGVIILCGLIWEPRYRGAALGKNAQWQPTGEKFIDPESSKLVEVDYDPQTGERRYRDV